MISLRRGFWVLALMISAMPAWATEPQPFTADTLKQIEETHAGKPFLLVMWEVSCPPCRRELAVLGRLKAAYPALRIALIATDEFRHRAEVAEILADKGLSGADAWLFADANIERLRYTVDPEWFGELPRNYFYAADGSRVGVSGMVRESALTAWVEEHADQF
ncbi:TlpA family protein disulfide reductase [Marinimicrobium alkaliphilum]|uniref:TlpA family protein disulfide reductase n=1 Tax=Marinimicrobium alkaliphilum TaxID=2202654 RepID=UPI000DB94FED|nr:TlpA family protein disulfide reductase [Marinimicrobium alkaliphilum]